MLVSNQRLSSAIDPATLVDLLRWRALHQPDQVAYTFLVDGEEKELRLTYGELDRRARVIGAVLQDLQARGERVLLLYPPSLEYLAAFFGCLYAGSIAVPAYPPTLTNMRRGSSRIRAIVQDAKPLAVLTTAPILSMVDDLSTQYPEFEKIRWLVSEHIAHDLADEWHAPMINGDTIAFLQYTSGSTAVPKGVMVSHGNLLYNHQMIQRAFQHPEQFAYVSWLPLFHDMGLIGNALQAVYVGAPCVLMSPVAFLQKPFRWLQAISRYKAYTSGGPNFAYDLCIRKVTPEQRATLDLSNWHIAFNGSEPVRLETLKRFAIAFESCGFRFEAFYPCYGLAEATLFVAGGLKVEPPTVLSVQSTALEQNRAIVSNMQDVSTRMLVSCGQTWSGQKIVVVDPESRVQCSDGEIGEIWVAGPNIAQGYWDRPQETEHTFQAYMADNGDEAFLRTGDLGFLKDGELYITGRLKDLIIIDGRNHYPQDIEQTVEQCHPAVRAGCCVAISVEAKDEERLVIMCEIDRRLFDQQEKEGRLANTFETLIQSIRRHVANNHDLRVSSVLLLKPGSIPKTSSGKVQRQACRNGSFDETLSVWEIE